ncbi:hypothetical protein ACFVYP_29575 [Kitasatospora sp. NPDC058201]|uniref:hypothetical protein n=1 Tax=unclassified Kitasatospora TaxID=2633591 RepID=UPI003668D51C
MKVEIDRHDWGSLRSSNGDHSLVLRAALLDLNEATSDRDVDLSIDRIEDEAITQGRLAESSPAATRCLVHGVSSLTGYALERTLETLTMISSGIETPATSDAAGGASARECMKEISLGFPAYCEILKLSEDIDCRSSAIDLILMCGLHNLHLRTAARSALSSAISSAELAELSDLISASLTELEQA